MIWGNRNFIGWCKECNVPLLGITCDTCNSKASSLYLRDKGEIRPLWKTELDLFNSIIEKEYGVADLIPPNSFINDSTDRVTYGEIIVDGEIICRLRFDNGKWNIKPYIGLANEVINRGSKKKTIELYPFLGTQILDGKSMLLNTIISSEKKFKRGEYVILKAGNVIAISTSPIDLGKESSSQANFTILESQVLSEKKFRGTDLDQAVKSNLRHLESIEKEAVNSIKLEKNKQKLKLICSFSGGKDSIVVLDLTTKAMKNEEFDIVFVDTKNEFKETLEYIKKVEHHFNIKITILPARHDIFDMWSSFGPPTYSYRWCCKTQKFAPLNNFIKKKYPSGVLSIVGTRKNESIRRSLSIKKSSTNNWITEQKMFLAIHEWSELEIWLHIIKHKLPPNKVYLNGVKRCGCWSCPATHIGTFDIMKRSYPGLINKLTHNINRFSIQKEDDPIKAIAKWKNNGKKVSLGYQNTKLTPCKDGTRYFILSKPVKESIDFLKVFGDIESKGPIIKIKGMIDASLVGNKLIIKGFEQDKLNQRGINESEALAYIEKQIHKCEHCVKCGLCTSHCPSEAITINPHFHIDETKCNQCLKCVKDTCAVVSYFEKENMVLK